MSIKKIIAISILSLILLFLAAVYFIPPNVTEITDTKRLYNVDSVHFEGFSDDTPFEKINGKYINVKFDLKVIKRFFWIYMEGSITIGEKEYYPHLYDHKRASVIIPAFGGGPGSPDNSFMYISEDLSHIMLLISKDLGKETEGVWLNCTDLADFKKGMSALNPSISFEWEHDNNGK